LPRKITGRGFSILREQVFESVLVPPGVFLFLRQKLDIGIVHDVERDRPGGIGDEQVLVEVPDPLELRILLF